jgi:hypothetical protein
MSRIYGDRVTRTMPDSDYASDSTPTAPMPTQTVQGGVDSENQTTPETHRVESPERVHGDDPQFLPPTKI